MQIKQLAAMVSVLSTILFVGMSSVGAKEANLANNILSTTVDVRADMEKTTNANLDK